MLDDSTTITQLKVKAAKFVLDRDWRQFHGAKNLSMALAAEAAELMEPFIFTQNKEEAAQVVTEKKEDIKDELADVLLATLMFADEFDIDISDAFMKKLAKTEAKYPVEKAKGRNKKYTEI